MSMVGHGSSRKNTRETALWKVILVSWLIAFFEYCLQVPANRLGYGQFTVAQLKIVQEVITLVVFARYFLVHLAESHLTQRLFGQILWRIERLAWHPT